MPLRAPTSLERAYLTVPRHPIMRDKKPRDVAGVVRDIYAPIAVANVDLPQVKPADAHQPTQLLNTKDFVNIVRADLQSGKASGWIVVNITGLKYINDKVVGGHNAGNAYKSTVAAVLRTEAAEAFGVPIEAVEIIDNGSNFVIKVVDGAKAGPLMERIQTTADKGIVFSYKYKNRTRTSFYSKATEGREHIFNVGQITYEQETSLVITEAGIKGGLGEEIYYLNRSKDVPSDRPGKEHVISRNEAVVLNSHDVRARIVSSENYPGVSAPVGTPADFVEPTSGMLNVHGVSAQAINLLRQGKTLHYATFDVNATGSFRSLGFFGEIVMDGLFAVRIPEAATILPPGITIARHGENSEEYSLIADAKTMTEEEFRGYLGKFTKALSEKPFIVLAEERELRKTEFGRKYLAEHPSAPRKTMVLTDGSSMEAVEIDAVEATRRGGHRGITITMATGMISPLRGPDEKTQDTYLKQSHAIMEYAELAKKLNPNRRNVIVEVDFTGQKIKGRISPLTREVADPKNSRVSQDGGNQPKFIDKLVDFAVDHNYMIEFTARDGEIANIKILNEAEIVRSKNGKPMCFTMKEGGRLKRRASAGGLKVAAPVSPKISQQSHLLNLTAKTETKVK